MLPRHWPSRSLVPARAAGWLIPAPKTGSAFGEVIGLAPPTDPITGLAEPLALALGRVPRTARTKSTATTLRVLGIAPDVATGLSANVAWRRVTAGLVREHTFQPVLRPQASVNDVHRRRAFQVPSLPKDRHQSAAHRAGLMAQRSLRIDNHRVPGKESAAPPWVHTRVQRLERRLAFLRDAEVLQYRIHRCKEVAPFRVVP